ncbi:MAG: SH3 domain-containing protein [Leptolyngbyaceae cyanobacterium]
MGLATYAKADTAPAHCDLYAPGETYAYLSSTCTFSQRQGYIGVQFQVNNIRYDFTPTGQSGEYTDQYGGLIDQDVFESGQSFEFPDGSELYVYWDYNSSYGSEPVQEYGQRVGTLYAHDRGSQINVRSEPTIYSYAQSYGLAGDQIEILQCVQDTDTASSDLNWCEVQFLESGAVGWVRSDFIIFPSDGF